MLFSPYQLDRTLSRAPYYMLAGIACLFLGRMADVGLVSSFALMSLGPSFGCVRNYRVEPGIWMLAALWGGLYFLVVLIAVIGNVSDIFRGAAAPWWIACDCMISLRIQLMLVRVMSSVVAHNRNMTSNSDLTD
jgi:hypothetical protein